jgi:dedicated sortase system histidine kinase
MRLRGTLILILLAALLLPWAGWQLVRQIEALLRAGQERAQVASAQAIGRALAASVPDLPGGGQGLYVHRLAAAPLLDGSRDDWNAREGQRTRDGRLALVAAAAQGQLWLLIEARDATRARADVGTPFGAVGDAIEITLRDARGFRSYRLGNAAPGALQVDPREPGAPLGEWQETADGYRIELALAAPAPAAVLSLRMLDRDSAAEQTILLPETQGEGYALLWPDARIDRALAAFAPDAGRVRYLSAEGWILGSAGALDESASIDTVAAPYWRTLVYRRLLAPRAESADEMAWEHERVDVPLVWQALSGISASSVRASGGSDAVIVTAAVPVRQAGQVAGALLLEQPSEGLLVLANQAVLGVMAASLLAVLLASLILIGYAGVLSFRIRRLRNAAERALRPDGRLDPNLPHLGAKDDLGDLSRSFARLLGEIGTYTDYLRTLASKLSHELNTPLAIVRSSLDNLEHEQLSPAARTYSQRARSGAERLGGILRSMAEASRMERAIAAAEGEDFDLAELVRGCAEAYRDLVRPRELRLDAPNAPLMLHGAPELIAQALDKLVDNARSFAPEQGWIRIRLQALENGARISVANNGPPLPEKMQERLFDSLVSVREGPAAGVAPHLGLGLFVVRLIAELHRGSAAAANLPEGEGVEFSLAIAGMPRRRL